MKKVKKLIVGNWKMSPASSVESVKIVKGILKNYTRFKNVVPVICPPYIFLDSVKKELKIKKSIILGAQDVFWETEGSFTGEVSLDMLKSLGVSHIIIGHSERRALGDTDEIVNNKLKTVLKYGITPILCIGEKDRDESGVYMQIVSNQLNEAFKNIPKLSLQNIVIAYEPVWAIGKNATREATQAETLEMSIFIKRYLSDFFGKNSIEIPILYGGSVNTKNAEVFLREGGVGGLLIGRDSLDPKKFIEILKIAENI